MIACVGAGQAAEKIRYSEIPTHLASFGTTLTNRGFTVTTLDGKQHRGRKLELESDHLRIFQGQDSWEDLSSDQVSRIEISQTHRFFHQVAGSAVIPVEDAAYFCSGFGLGGFNPLCFLPVTALFSPDWAYTAVTAPAFLAADVVAPFIPPKVYEIVH